MTSEFERETELPDDERNKLAKDFLGEALRILHHDKYPYKDDDSKDFEIRAYRYTLTFKREPRKDYICLYRKGIQQDLNIEEITIRVNYAEDRSKVIPFINGSKVEDSFLGYSITCHFPEWPTDSFSNNSRAVEGITNFISAFKETP